MNNNESLNHSSPLPPLRIYHFLTWMFVTAAFMAAEKSFLEFADILVDSTVAIHSVIGISALTALIFVLYWHCTGNAFLMEPGHGLLIIKSLDLVWGGVCLWALYAYDWIQNGLNWTISSHIAGLLIEWAGVISMSIQLCLGILLSCNRKWSIRWRRFYVFYAIVLGLSLAAKLAQMRYLNTQQVAIGHTWVLWVDQAISIIPLLGSAIGLVFVCFCDQRDKIKHHWSHWYGVACMLLWASIFTAAVIWAALFPSEWTSYPPMPTP